MLEVDHILPRCEGGIDDAGNLVTSCAECNRGKAGVLLGHAMPQIDELEVLATVQESLERRARMAEGLAAAKLEREAIDEIEDVITRDYEADVGELPNRGSLSLRRFAAKLPLHEIEDAILHTAIAAKHHWSDYRRFRYFCGVCWRKIRQHDVLPADDASY